MSIFHRHLEIGLRCLSISDDEPTPLVRGDLPDAFASGYVLGMHKTHTYSPALSSDMHNSELHKFLLADIKCLPDKIRQHCANYLNDTYTSDTTKHNRSAARDAFVYGYCAAIHRAHKYDIVLGLTKHDQRARIMGDLLALQKNHENAQRACCRIIANHYGLQGNNSKFRALLNDGGYIDSSGQTFDKYGQRVDMVDTTQDTDND